MGRGRGSQRQVGRRFVQQRNPVYGGTDRWRVSQSEAEAERPITVADVVGSAALTLVQNAFPLGYVGSLSIKNGIATSLKLSHPRRRATFRCEVHDGKVVVFGSAAFGMYGRIGEVQLCDVELREKLAIIVGQYSNKVDAERDDFDRMHTRYVR